MGLNNLFSTPIYMEKVTENSRESISSELNFLYNSLELKQNVNTFNPLTSHDVTVDSNGTLFSSNILTGCNKFNTFLHYSVEQYFKSLGFPNFDFIVTESWFTCTTKGKHAPVHSHGNSDISGVYYLKTNKKDGNLVLKNPFTFTNGNFIYFLHNHNNSQQELPLEEGLLILWPSVLEHSTYVNETSHDRISLSFNISISRYPFTFETSKEQSLNKPIGILSP
jgi:uncharacterized protein (TIGR02466 family)